MIAAPLEANCTQSDAQFRTGAGLDEQWLRERGVPRRSARHDGTRNSGREENSRSEETGCNPSSL